MAETTIKVGGKAYRLVVLRIMEWDEKGRPSKAIIGYGDTTFDLRDDSVSREFITGFVNADATEGNEAKDVH